MRRAAAVGSAALVVLSLSACVAHPVGPARTFAKYEGKAATTAKSALSAVQTARLVSQAAVRHDLFGTYVGDTLGEAEDAVSGVAGTFASIQPPNEDADGLRAELVGLLSDTEDHLSALRIAARRGQIDRLSDLAQPLAGDAAQLDAFVEGHS